MLQCLVFVILLNIAQLEQSFADSKNTRQPDRTPFPWNQSKRGSVYVSANHPLWLLEGSSRQHNMQSHILAANKPLRRPLRQRKDKLTRANSRVYKLPQRLKLPSHYEHPGRRSISRTPRKSLAGLTSEDILNQPEHTREQKEKQHYQIINSAQTWYMPQFDSLPGEDNADSLPVFIYNGPKGELLLNTMLSAHKYPMQEPVPGQILYPPTAPLFRPKPIVQRYRHNSQTDPLNLTLIPFYAHEAIDPPRSLQLETNPSIVTTTAAPATVLYAAPLQEMTSSNTSFRKKKKQARSKWQDYKAYHSQHDVRWQPTDDIELLQTTTPFPLALASPLRNHRLEEFDAPTTSLPLEEQNQTLEEADESNFNIVYMDESVEKPQTKKDNAATTAPPKSVHSSRYSVSQAYYAFPVFTLAKLLKPQNTPELEGKREQPELQQAAEVDVKQDEAASDTWFILNSRYKGHLKHLNNRRLSSRYVQKAASVALTGSKPDAKLSA